MLGGIAVVAGLGIMVLHQVVPDVPLPDDAGVVRRARLDLQEPLRPNAPLGNEVGATAGGSRLFG